MENSKSCKWRILVKGEGGGEGGGPSEPPSPSSSSSSVSSEASKHSSHRKKSSKKTDHNLPLLKLDVKFELSTYDGELNVEKLDNWIKQIEVYCRVQRIMDEVAKIQLASLRLSGTTLIWWESKMQVDLVQKGKVISSWDKFTKAIRKQFYPLAHTQMEMIEWQHLRQGKGQNIQAYTHEFKKKALSLGIMLYTHETLLKYIGGMHSYLRHTILMFILLTLIRCQYKLHI
jgi:hypothetical protein